MCRSILIVLYALMFISCSQAGKESNSSANQMNNESIEDEQVEGSIFSYDQMTIESYQKFSLDESGNCAHLIKYSQYDNVNLGVQFSSCRLALSALTDTLEFEYVVEFPNSTIEIVDINFDGYLDLLVAAWEFCGSGGCEHEMFLFDPYTMTFVKDEQISGLNITIDSYSSRVVVGHSSGACNGFSTTYRWEEEKELVAVKKNDRRNCEDTVTILDKN